MNRNFKVVFSKARGALMVVNEATSSVQAKGTKTVIAAAVAALSLGAGVASAAQTFTDVTLDAGDSLTVTSKDGTSVYAPAGTVTGTTNATSDNTNKTFAATGDTLDTGAKVYLNGGELVLTGTTTDAVVKADDAANNKTTSGTITLNSVASAGKGTEVSYSAIEGGTFSKLDLNLNVFNAATGGTAGNVSIGNVANDLKIKEGTLKTGTIEGSSTAANKVSGTATITGKNLEFGVATGTVGDNKEPSATNPGSAYDFDNAADVKLDVTAAETVKFNKGTITNAGTMTVTGKTGVTVEKEVSIANTGDLTFKDDAKVDFNADYTATAGRLFIESKANTISGNITADSLKFGTRITDSDTAKETNQVVITATNSGKNTIKYGSTVDVKALTVEDAATTINGTLKAAATAVTDKTTAGLTVVDTIGTTGKKQYAAVSLGDITVGSAASGAQGNTSFTLTNQAENAVEASSLTVVKNSTTANTFALNAGKFSVGKLTNQGKVTLTDGEEFTLTGEGANASGAEITLASSKEYASLVVAEGASLQNQGSVTATDGEGKIYVGGTLTNLPKIAATTTTAEVPAGTIKAAAVEVDGVLSTALDTTYDVAETTINTAGELQTSLNAILDPTNATATTPKDALEIANTINLEGKITTAAGAEVQYYIVNATDGAFTIKEADKTFNTVQVKAGEFKTDDADVTLSVLDVKDAGTVKVNGGTLNVTTLKTVAEKSVTVEDGTLATSLTGLGLKYTDSGFAAADATTAGAGKVEGKSIVLGTSSLLDLDLGSVTEVTSAQLTGLTGLVSDDATSKGLIDIGATQIKEVKESITNGKIEYSKLSAIAGVTNDTVKSVTVTKVGESISGKDAIYGTIEQEDTAAPSKNFTITDVSLTLTGTGNLVSYTNTTDGKKVPTLSTIKFSTADSELVTTGEGAQIGQVGDSDQNGSLYVKSGDLTANGSVTINSLEVASGAKLSIADDKDGKGYAVKTGTATGEATAIISGELAAANSAVEFGSTAIYNGSTVNFDDINQVTGKLAAKTLTLKGDTLVAQGGTVEAGELDASNTTVFVGNSASAGSLSVGELTAGSIYADATWKEDGSAAAVSLVAVKKAADNNTLVEADRSSIVSVGTNDVAAGTAAFAKTGFTLAKTDAAKKEYSINTKTVNSVVYAEGLQYAGNVHAGNDNANVSIGANSMLLIDATKVDATGEKSVFVQGVSMAENSVLYVDNVKNGDKISLTATTQRDSIKADLVHEGDLLMGANEDKFTDGVLEFGMHDKADVVDKLGNVAGLDAIYGMYENGENVGNTNAQFFRDLMSSQTSSAYDSAAGEWNFQPSARL